MIGTYAVGQEAGRSREGRHRGFQLAVGRGAGRSPSRGKACTATGATAAPRGKAAGAARRKADAGCRRHDWRQAPRPAPTDWRRQTEAVEGRLHERPRTRARRSARRRPAQAAAAMAVGAGRPTVFCRGLKYLFGKGYHALHV
jgi:hypothetical protein